MSRKKGLPIRKRTTKTGARWDIEVYLGRDRETGKRLFHRETFKSYREAPGVRPRRVGPAVRG